MAVITAIEIQDKRKNRRSIFLNGKFAIGVDESIISGLNLKVGREITEEELNNIVHAELVNQAKERALKLLDYRKRSRLEIEQKLKKADYEQGVIDEVIQNLEELGFIDDLDFSQSWVNSRKSGKGMGKNRIKWELKQKGIDKEVLDSALLSLNSEDEYETALKSAENRWRKDKDPDIRAKKRRLISYLSRQGFSWETANKVVETISYNNDDLV